MQSFFISRDMSRAAGPSTLLHCLWHRTTWSRSMVYHHDAERYGLRVALSTLAGARTYAW